MSIKHANMYYVFYVGIPNQLYVEYAAKLLGFSVKIAWYDLPFKKLDKYFDLKILFADYFCVVHSVNRVINNPITSINFL